MEQQLKVKTDSPYLSPTPHRGKRNESAYLPLIAKKIAEIKELPVEKIAEATTSCFFFNQIYLLNNVKCPVYCLLISFISITYQ